MPKFVLMPHTSGFGHRIRCDTLGRSLMSADHNNNVVITVRRDDAVPTREYTVVPTTRSRVGRTKAIVTASVLVEDGYPVVDFRVKLMKLLGGKLVLVVQPTGFSEAPAVRDALCAADMILVPYPSELFQPESALVPFMQKVHVISPIVPSAQAPRRPRQGGILVYVLVTRPRDGFSVLVEEARQVLQSRMGTTVDVEARYGRLLSPEDHVRSLSRCHVVLTQGMTSAFEALRLHIPVVLVPHPDVREQLATAESLARARLAVRVSPEDLTAQVLATAIERAISEPLPRIPDSLRTQGVDQATGLLMGLAGSPEAHATRPAISIISTNYNCAHALDAHLRSVFGQFRPDEFEYVIVDNYSDDRSEEILREWASVHPNLRWIQARCTMGRGREIACRYSRAPYLLVVDTDTVYSAILARFVYRAIEEWPRHAVQAIYAGVFPRYLWRIAGGRQNYNTGEDFEMWMRLCALGLMKWYPLRTGENVKEPWAQDAVDYLSDRYTRFRRFQRLLRAEFDALRLARFDTVDVRSLWTENTVDLGLGPTETEWFGSRKVGPLVDRARSFARASMRILRS